MSQDEIKIVKFKQELPPQWFVLLIGPDIFSVLSHNMNTHHRFLILPLLPHPLSWLQFTQAVDSHFMLMVV